MKRIAIAVSFLALAAVSFGQTYRLQAKFPEGRKERLVTSMLMKMGFEAPMMPEPMQMDMRQTQSITAHIVKSTSAGSTLKMTFGKTTFSSSMPEMGAIPEMGDDMFAGQSITLSLDPRGRVKSVTGFDKIVDDPEIGAMTSELMKESGIERMMGFYFGGFLPSKAVRLGETWEDKWDFAMGPMSMNFNITYRLLDVSVVDGKRIARIWMSGTGAMDTEASGMPPGVDMSKMAIRINGTTLFDIDRGWMQSQTMNMEMSGSFDVPEAGGAATMTSSIRSTTRSIPVK